MIKQKKWSVLNPENSITTHISQKFGLSCTISKLLVNRGIVKDEDVEAFINPNDTSQFLNPFMLSGMDTAVSEILKSVENNEKIAVYGDYDVDGITSTYIVFDYISSLGADVVFYIPDRADEGYGVNTGAIDKLADLGVSLVITVDVGITAVSEVEYAKNKNLKFVITDHHTPKDDIPDALAVINPKLKGDLYPNKNLAGVGVAYKLVYALSGCNKLIMNKYAEAAAIGTIADMVALIGENRFIASYGIQMLSKTENPGLNALMEVSSIDKKNINSTNVSFGIAPRLNAAGRIASAESSVRLFLEKDPENAREIAIYLDEGNKLRQKEEQNILTEAIDIIEKNKLYDDNVIVVANSNWHHGVIGIVSSKITDKYYKPSTVISINDDGTAKASGRSIAGFNLFDALSACSDTLTKFGGHDLAAGFSLLECNIDKFRKKINEYSKGIMNEEMLTPNIIIDSELHSEDLNLNLASELRIMEPYGIGNSQPIFSINDVLIKNIRLHKSGKHAFINFRKKNSYFDAPAFNLAETIADYGIGEHICLAGTLNINNYKGTDNVQFIVRDCHHDDKSSLSVPNLRIIYIHLHAYTENKFNTFKINDLIEQLKKNSSRYFSKNQIITSFEIFKELGLFDFEYSGEYVNISKGINYGSKIDLTSSDIFNKINC